MIHILWLLVVSLQRAYEHSWSFIHLVTLVHLYRRHAAKSDDMRTLAIWDRPKVNSKKSLFHTRMGLLLPPHLVVNNAIAVTCLSLFSLAKTLPAQMDA